MRDLIVGFTCLVAALPAFLGPNVLRAQEELSVLSATEEPAPRKMLYRYLLVEAPWTRMLPQAGAKRESSVRLVFHGVQRAETVGGAELPHVAQVSGTWAAGNRA